MTEYVAGFMFSEDKRSVALIRKNRPEWQKGKWNGIGGHVEPKENSHEAMIREFEEETGVWTRSWDHFCSLHGPWGVVRFYRTTGDLTKLRSMTDEGIGTFPAMYVQRENIVPNLAWLIPMALGEHNDFATVTHRDEEAPFGGW